MTQRTTQFAKANGKATPASIDAFERHLCGHWRSPGLANGSVSEQHVMVVNIRYSHSAHFPIKAKIAVLKDLHCPADPEKSFAALTALGRMAAVSPEARKAFARAAKRWHGDITMKAVYPEEWLQGMRFIQNSSRWLPEDVQVNVCGKAPLPPKASPDDGYKWELWGGDDPKPRRWF